MLPRGVKLTADDIREGVVCVLSVNVPVAVSHLQFQGQRKDLRALDAVAHNVKEELWPV